MMCGMCDGDGTCTIASGSSSIGNTKEKMQEKLNVKPNATIDNIGAKQLEDIIAKTVKKALEKM